MAFPRLTLLVVAVILSILPVRAQNSFGFRKISSWPGFVRGTPADLEVIDNFAYVAMGEGGLCIVDVTSRSAPVVVGRVDLPGNATRIKVIGDYAYLSCGSAGMQIVNVANPSAPSLTGSFETGGTASAVGLAYPYAFIADGVNGVVVADVTNPAAPTLATQLPFPGTVYGLEAELVTTIDINTQVTTTNRYLQVVNGTNGFLAYRVTDPLSPELHQHDVGPGWDARAITRFGREVFWIERRFITRYDFTRRPVLSPLILVDNNLPVNPVTKMSVVPIGSSGRLGFDLFIGSIRYSGALLFPNATDLHVSQLSRSQPAVAGSEDGYEYVLDNDKGLLVFKNGLVSATAIGGQATRLKLTGDRVYAADGQQGLEILKVESDGTLAALSRYADESAPTAFDVAGSNVFGWFGDTNLNMLDVSDSAQPTLLTNAAPTLTSNLALLAGRDVAIQDGFAYVADNLAVHVMNVANPAKPFRLLRLSVNSTSLNSIGVSGTNIIGADGAGILSIGINPDKSLTLLQRLNTSARNGRRVKLAGTLAYVCERAGGLKIYDVSDATNIVAVGSFDTPGNAFAVAVEGSYAYVADQQDGILVLNVSDPANPTLVATLPMSNSPLDIEVRNNRLFVAQGVEGISIWDLVPKQAQTIDFPAIADKAANNPPFTITATASSGLPVQFEVMGGPASIQGNKVTVYAAGSVTIRATQSGNDEFSPIFAERTFAVTLATQTLNIPEITGKTTRNAPFELSVSSSSGLPVTIVLSGPAYIGTIDFVTNKGIVTITGSGTVTILASQKGNSIWAPIQIEKTFTVIEQARDLQTISMPQPSVLSVDDDPFPFPIAASSGLPVDVTVTGPVTLENKIMTVTGPGAVSVAVSQAGDKDFEPVTLTRTFNVYDLPGAATANVILHNPSLPPAETAPGADPDHDGLPNIVEFILRSDPTSATSNEGHISASVFESGGSRYLKVHYFKPRSLRYPVGIQVADFARYPSMTWQSLPVGFNEDGTGDVFWALNPTYKFPMARFVVQYP